MAPDQLLKKLYQQRQYLPLEPGDPYYEPLYEKHGVEDPVALMQKNIKLSDNESIQMFSGFRGSGKTTELFRLKADLEQQGYVVLYGDALKYLNPAQEIDISDFLIVLAGTFSDALEDEGLDDFARDSYWDRFTNYLTTTDVKLEEVGLKTGADLKLNLKTAPTFRQMLREKLANHIGGLKRNVDRFFEDGVKALQARRGQTFAGVVFLFDQMEQVRGSLANEQEVIHSVERLFSQHLKLLEIPYLHLVYTVPPWLKFVLPNTVRIQILPSIRQWNNDVSRTEYPHGRQTLRSLIHRRFGPAEFNQFFGGQGSHHPQADRLIDSCGGHFRDLLLLLRETVLRVQTFPVTPEVIDNAIVAVRSNFLPIAIEDAKWLDRIGRDRDTALQTTDKNDVSRLTRFLDTHFVLFFTNGEEWYDLHPLIRDEVKKIVGREAAQTSAVP